MRWQHSGSIGRLIVVMTLSLLSFISVFPFYPAAAVSTVTIKAPTSGVVYTSVRFNATVLGNTTRVIFTWNYGDGTGNNSTGVTNSTFHGYTIKGSYKVTVNATDTTRNNATQVPPFATITIAPVALTVLPITGPSAVTLGDPVSLSVSAGGGTSPYSFSWNFGDGTGNVAGGMSNPNGQSHTYATTGTFTVRVNATDANAKLASRSRTVQVLPLSVLGLDCAYGSQVEGVVFPASITIAYPYSGIDSDGTLDTSCQATYLADTDTTTPALHPLVSDNPSGLSPGAGGGLTIDVVAQLNSVTNINGFDVSLNYDTKVLSAVLIDQSGLIWACTGPGPAPCSGVTTVLTFASTIDRTNGVVHVEQVVIGATQGGVSEFFRVRFDIIGASKGTPITILPGSTLTSPGSVPHTTKSLNSPGVDTTSIFDVLSPGTTMNGVANWTFTPNPQVAGSPLTFTAAASCPGCTGALTYYWDFSSSDSPSYVAKTQATGAAVTITGPPPVINRVTLTVNDTATPAHSMRITRLLSLAGLKATPSLTTLALGTAGGSWSAQWLGGVTTSTVGYSGSWIFCPGGPSNKAVCSNPVQSISQSGTSITQTSSVSGITYNFAGLYNVTLKVSDAPESQIGTVPIGNTVLTSFLVNVTGSAPAYTVTVSVDDNSPGAGKVVTIRANATYNASPLYPAAFRVSRWNYVFDFGDGSPLVTVPQNLTASVKHTFPSTGMFTVRVQAQESGTRAVSQIQENGFLTIRPFCPTTSACDFTLSVASPVVGAVATFTASASGGVPPYTFTWDFGDSSTGTGATVNHTYKSAGTYNLILTIKDSNGQVQTIKKTVTVTQGGGGGDLAGTLTSPLVLAGIAAAAAIILGSIVYMRRRARKLAMSKATPSQT